MTTKKKAPVGNKEETNNNNNKKSWPNLPQRLIKHIQKHPILMRSINFGSVTKSWKSAMNKRHCNQREQTQPYNWLCVSDEYDQDDMKPQFWSMSFPGYWYYSRWYSKRWSGGRPWKNFWGCCHGHLVARRVTQLYLVNPVGHGWRNLPDFEDHIPFKCAAVSSSPSDNSNKSCVFLVVTGISSPAFMFYRLIGKPNSYEWTKKDCTLVDPYDNHFPNRKHDQKQTYMRFTNAIGFNGKFYALSSQGTLVVIEDVVDVSYDGQRRYEITGFGKTRAVPSLVPCKGFRECLIESNGEILLIFLVCRKTVNVVDDVEAFRLSFDTLSWIKMESLAERTLFVGSDCCISVCADKVGCRDNCVYFTQRGLDNDWWEYDMLVRGISPVWTNVSHSRTRKCLEWDKPIAQDDEEAHEEI